MAFIGSRYDPSLSRPGSSFRDHLIQCVGSHSDTGRCLARLVFCAGTSVASFSRAILGGGGAPGCDRARLLSDGLAVRTGRRSRKSRTLDRAMGQFGHLLAAATVGLRSALRRGFQSYPGTDVARAPRDESMRSATAPLTNCFEGTGRTYGQPRHSGMPDAAVMHGFAFPTISTSNINAAERCAGKGKREGSFAGNCMPFHHHTPEPNLDRHG